MPHRIKKKPVGELMEEKRHYLYDVSMSYVEPGWQDRYLEMVKDLDIRLRQKYPAFFSELQLYQNGPMNYVVVAVYYDVEGVEDELGKILKFVNKEYQMRVGRNVRRKQILKFDRAKKLHGQK